MLLLIASALAATPSNPGDVVITELLLDPTNPLSDLEWYELHAPGASMDLDGCWQVEGHYEGADWKGTEYEIPRTVDGPVTVPAGGYGVISKNTSAVNDDPTYVGDTVCVAYDAPDDSRQCIAESLDIFSGSVYLGSSSNDVETLCILCGGTDEPPEEDGCNNPGDWLVIDSVEFDAGLLEGCPLDDNACTLNLAPGLADQHTANDDLSNWCVPTTSYWDPAFSGVVAEGTEYLGTPGTEGDCPNYAWPDVGGMVFTEVIASPQEVPEFFELTNVSGADVELTLCVVQRYKAESPDDVDDYALTDALTVLNGAVQLFVSDDEGCLGAEVDDTGMARDCAAEGVPYSGISFTNDQDEVLELWCPDGAGGDVLIDQIAFNMTELGVRDGHSYMLAPSAVDGGDAANANDNASNWCEAGFSQCFADVTAEDCNYGSPGVVEDCLTELPEPPVGCVRCSTGGLPSPWALGGIAGLVALAGLRRRRR
jgi:hypothetical protein